MSTVIHPKIHSCCALLNKALVFVSLLYFPAKVEKLSSKAEKINDCLYIINCI